MPTNTGTVNAKFEMKADGQFCIHAFGLHSGWTGYRHIAILNIKNGRKFFGVSAYYEGTFPIEQVIEWTPHPTEKLDA